MLLTTDRLMKNQTPISTKRFPFFHEAPTMYMDAAAMGKGLVTGKVAKRVPYALPPPFSATTIVP